MEFLQFGGSSESEVRSFAGVSDGHMQTMLLPRQNGLRAHARPTPR
jgi:hypothetical protein